MAYRTAPRLRRPGQRYPTTPVDLDDLPPSVRKEIERLRAAEACAELGEIMPYKRDPRAS